MSKDKPADVVWPEGPVRVYPWMPRMVIIQDGDCELLAVVGFGKDGKPLKNGETLTIQMPGSFTLD